MNEISLSGSWGFIPDPDSLLTYEDIKKRIDSGEKIPEMEIPSNWELKGLNNYNGSVWYIRAFNSFDETCGMDILRFNGIDYYSDIWVNDKFIGSHEGYFGMFEFIVTSHLKANAKNLLVVKVTSPFEKPGDAWPYKKRLIKGIFNHHDCRPGGWNLEKGQDKNTGGIWNDILLLRTKEIYIASIKATSFLNSTLSKANLHVSFEYISASTKEEIKDVSIILKLSDEKEITIYRKFSFASGRGRAETIIPVDNPPLWKTWDLGEQPFCQLYISGENITGKTIRFAFRKFAIDDDSTFFLNDTRLFLRGTNIIPEQFLSLLSKERIVEMVSRIKEANINIVRVHAHVNRTELYEEFDRAGILVWQDFPLQWTYEESEEFYSSAVIRIKEMVNQLYNHPSIAFWCCHNEPGPQIETLDKLLRDAVEETDRSRIIRTASNYEEHPYDGWYWGKKEHYAATPMGPLVTEFGAQALPVYDSLKKFLGEISPIQPDWEKWEYHNFQFEQTFNVAEIEMGNTPEEFVENSQEYQKEVIKTAIDFYRRKRYKGVTGVFQFMFIDCWPSVTWSVIDYYGKEKKGFYQLKKSFQPIYLSVRMRQRKYFPGTKLQMDLWGINDLHKEYKNCYVKLTLNNKVLKVIDKLNFEKDSLFFLNYEEIEIILPNLEEGNYQLKFEVFDDEDELLSENEENIEIVNRIKNWS